VIKYFAYGSNMDLERITERIGRCPVAKPVTLAGYELRFNKKAKTNPEEGFANIESREGQVVPGVVYDITEEELTRIDGREGVQNGHYRHSAVSVKTADGNLIDAVAHVACGEWVREGLLPRQDYLDHLLAGERMLPEGHVQRLRQQEVLDNHEGGSN